MIEMVDTTRGPLPRVALDVQRVVVAENDDHRTVQINYLLNGEIVRQDGVVDVKRWPEGINLMPGSLAAGG